jgi:hypothetical protein
MSDQKAEAEAAAKEAEAQKTKSVEQSSKRMNVRPTPTQHEADLAALGHGVDKKEDDGSGPDPYANKALEPKSGNPGYQTRESRPAHAGRGATPASTS